MKLIPLGSAHSLNQSYDSVVAGMFTGATYTDLLFYDSSSHTMVIQQTDGSGKLNKYASLSNSSYRFSHILPGQFGGDSALDLLLFDEKKGRVYFAELDRRNLDMMGKLHSGQHGWKPNQHFATGNFGGNTLTDILGYDPATGMCEIGFWTGRGLGTRRSQIIDKGYTQVVAGNFNRTGYDDLFFYNKDRGEGAFYTVEPSGKLAEMRKLTGLATGKILIVAGQFGGTSLTDLLFYDANAGTFTFFTPDGRGALNLLNPPIGGQRKTWTHIVTGKFGGVSDLFLYDAADGHAEFLTITDLPTTDMPWYHWTSRESGRLNGEPAVVWRKPNEMEIFGRGMDNKLYQNSWDGAAWTGWKSHNDSLSLTGAPAAASNAPDRMVVFAASAVGPISKVFQKTWSNGAWSNWENRDEGVIVGEPTAVYTSATTLELFIRSQDNHVWQNVWNGSQWSGWNPLNDGFVVSSSPVALMADATTLVLFACAPDGVIYGKKRLSGVWTSWATVYPGRTYSKPAAIKATGGKLHLLARAIDDSTLWHNAQPPAGAWGPWHAMGEAITLIGAPVAVSHPTDVGRVDVFVAEATTGLLYHKTFSL